MNIESNTFDSNVENKARVFIALGSNLGDRLTFLQIALDHLPDVQRTSSVYETEPVGGPDDQGPYLNTVVELSTNASPKDLLLLAQRLESDAGRKRIMQNGPRTLDVDILLYFIDGNLIELTDSDLTVPHPRMQERNFVMVPLNEIAPDVVSHIPILANFGSTATGYVEIYKNGLVVR